MAELFTCKDVDSRFSRVFAYMSSILSKVDVENCPYMLQKVKLTKPDWSVYEWHQIGCICVGTIALIAQKYEEDPGVVAHLQGEMWSLVSTVCALIDNVERALPFIHIILAYCSYIEQIDSIQWLILTRLKSKIEATVSFVGVAGVELDEIANVGRLPEDIHLRSFGPLSEYFAKVECVVTVGMFEFQSSEAEEEKRIRLKRITSLIDYIMVLFS
jgi:hypothetical protein